MIFLGEAASVEAAISEMDRITADWTAQAARGECGWICADCCMCFPEGMPSECAHKIQSCTEIIKRDKRDANPTP